jgi:hypothetical protein
MYTPLKKESEPREIRVSSVKYNLTRFYEYVMRMAISIIVGSVLKVFYTLSREDMGKNFILTGLPILRQYFFLFPILLNFVLSGWLIVLFKHDEVYSNYNGNFIKYMYKTRIGYLITNLCLLFMFYMIYYQLYLPLWYEHEFELSGHVLAAILSGAIISNIHNTCENFKKMNIKTKSMEWVIVVCKFLKYHNIYVILWTTWIYHQTREVVLSYLISLVYALAINYLAIDRIVLSLFLNRASNVKKQKNIIFDKSIY